MDVNRFANLLLSKMSSPKGLSGVEEICSYVCLRQLCIKPLSFKLVKILYSILKNLRCDFFDYSYGVIFSINDPGEFQKTIYEVADSYCF